jgi:hypothetical protein
MVKTTLVEAVSPRRLRNTSYHRAPGSADRLAENQLVAPRAAKIISARRSDSRKRHGTLPDFRTYYAGR